MDAARPRRAGARCGGLHSPSPSPGLRTGERPAAGRPNPPPPPPRSAAAPPPHGSPPLPRRMAGDLASAPLQADEILGRRPVARPQQPRRTDRLAQRLLELVAAPAADRDRLDHRDAELVLKPLRVDLEPVAAGEI